MYGSFRASYTIFYTKAKRIISQEITYSSIENYLSQDIPIFKYLRVTLSDVEKEQSLQTIIPVIAPYILRKISISIDNIYKYLIERI